MLDRWMHWAAEQDVNERKGINHWHAADGLSDEHLKAERGREVCDQPLPSTCGRHGFLLLALKCAGAGHLLSQLPMSMDAPNALQKSGFIDDIRMDSWK